MIVGSDGVFDNLFNKDILKCLPSQTVNADVQKIANCLADSSLALSKDEAYDSPFAVNARKYKKRHPGGKEDDITVVVSKVNIALD